MIVPDFLHLPRGNPQCARSPSAWTGRGALRWKVRGIGRDESARCGGGGTRGGVDGAAAAAAPNARRTADAAGGKSGGCDAGTGAGVAVVVAVAAPLPPPWWTPRRGGRRHTRWLSFAPGVVHTRWDWKAPTEQCGQSGGAFDGLEASEFRIAADMGGPKCPVSIGQLRRLNGCVLGGRRAHWCIRHACIVG